MTRSLLPAAALALLLVSGVVHGLWTDRWRPAGAPAAWAARLERVPRVIGDWEGQDLPVEAHSLQVAEITGHVARAYVHRRTGAVVAVVLVCGRPGPISVHTPDVCYRGSGHGVVDTPARYAGPGGAEFWTARFRRADSALPTYLRFFWGWNGGAGWQAPANPRLEFARRPALYKLYVVRQLARLDEPPETDPCTEFLPLLLPELQRALFAEGDAGA